MLARSQKAASISQDEYKLMKASQEAGGYFRCRQCRRDVH
jgi:hypothetical protein